MSRRLLLLILGATAVLLTAIGLVLGPVLLCSGEECPSVATLQSYTPPQASRVFAVDGSVVADLSPQRRVVVELGEVAPVLRDGVVAVEDRRFWRHAGIDFRGVARAVTRNTLAVSFREGFSTIEMQLARNVFPETLRLSDKLRRKAWEVALAGQMGLRLGKEEILSLYLNQIYMGGGLYGVEAAAQGYLGKSAADVSTAEAALLVAIIKTPERYNPRRNPRAAIERRNVVLGVMAREGVITREEADRARSTPLRLAPPYESSGPAPYFVVSVRRELRVLFGPDADTRGLRVFTGLDPAVQRAAQRAITEQIARIESGARGRYVHSRPDGRPGPAEGSESPYLQGMVVALDPATGDVRALVGGRDFAHSQYDRALQARRQPGSAFKPIVFATAVERGMPVTTRISAARVAVETAGSPTWHPGDHLADSVESLSMRDALRLSSNSAAVRIGQWAGESRVMDMARSLGISTHIPPYPAMHLGAAEVIPAELVASYAAFGNGGFLVRPRLIARVEDADGRVLWRAPDGRERALSEAAAFLTLTMMEDVVDRGTASVIRGSGFWHPAAGKTGTTNDGKDAWFIGLTPDLVAGVWLGFDRPRRIVPGGGGGSLAAPVWGDLMKEVYATRPAPAAWLPPRTVVSMPVDTASGHAATPNCPPDHVRVEYFLPGTEPGRYCELHPYDGMGRLLDRLWNRVRRIF